MKVKDDDAGEERKDNGQAGSKALHDVVRVFDDEGGDETTKDLDRDDSPCPGTKVVEEVLEEAGGMGGVEDREEGGNEREEGELNVTDPEISL